MNKENQFELKVLFTSLLVYGLVVVGVVAISFRVFGINDTYSSVLAGTWGAAAAMFVAIKLSKRRDI